MAESCYFCRETECLQTHHIVPQRLEGTDNEENLVTLCPTCHRKIEKLYNKRFYEKLGVEEPIYHSLNTEERNSLYEQLEIEDLEGISHGRNWDIVNDNKGRITFMCPECGVYGKPKNFVIAKNRTEFVIEVVCKHCKTFGHVKFFGKQKSDIIAEKVDFFG